MHTWMDARVAKGRGKMECDTADARGPYRRGQLGGILAERRAAGVGFTRRHGAAVGRRDGRCTTHTRGPYGFGHLGGILAERRAAGVGFRRQDGAAVGHRDGRCTENDSTRLIHRYLILQSGWAVPKD